MQAQMYVLDNYGHLCTVVCTQSLVVIWCTVCWLLGTAQVFQKEIPNGQISKTDVWWVMDELLMMESQRYKYSNIILIIYWFTISV